MGRDHTLFALEAGRVVFESNKLTGRKTVHVKMPGGVPLHPAFTHLEERFAELERKYGVRNTVAAV